MDLVLTVRDTQIWPIQYAIMAKWPVSLPDIFLSYQFKSENVPLQSCVAYIVPSLHRSHGISCEMWRAHVGQLSNLYWTNTMVERGMLFEEMGGGLHLE